jgi:Zn-dependent peptidase ImmA (M78 family)/transcriptional regulator with XRE-family HTH domain
VLTADPVMLATARQARGLTQAELARRTGLSQAFLSKAEAGQVELDGDRLSRTADMLRYPVSLLCMRAQEHSLVSACAFHRKRSSLPVSKIRQVHASLDLARVQAEELLRDIAAPPVWLRRIRPSADRVTGPREIARRVRADLGLPDGPITDLTAAVEAAGVVVLSWDLGHRQGDAVSQWLEGHRPVMLLYSAAPGDRLRYSSGHELGHLVMHTEPVERQEQQADMFAGELLMPATVIGDELGNLDMPALARLKARWGVSMAALIRRAHDLGAISDYRYKELNIEMSKAGWRTREPVQIPAERPGLLADAVTRLRGKGLDDQAIAERARMHVNDLLTLVNQEGAA